MRASKLVNGLFALVAVGVAFSALPMAASAKANIIIVNVDGPGEGFNDPTPRAPIGGNSGTTVGDQRLNAFQEAANIWGASLNTNVPVRIRAAFDPLTCTATSATLGSAGALYVYSNFTGAQYPNVWYNESLANKIAQVDLNPPGNPGDIYDGADINARFNSSIGTVPGCLTGSDWYYGLDNNHGLNTDLVTVLLHEFGHGLGFQSFVSRTDGSYFFGGPGVFGLFVRDNTTNMLWTDMTNTQRVASIKNGRNVAWTGSSVTSQLPNVLVAGTLLLRVSAPAAIAGIYSVGTANFGAVLNSPGVSGTMVLALDAADGAGPTTTDGCSAVTNAAAVAGNIALVDRGSCGFALKAKNLQNAGATAVVIANLVTSSPASPPGGMSGVDATLVVPSVLITNDAGNAIKAQLGTGVTATVGLDMSVRAGADASNRGLLYTPNPVVPGSSISHWDTSAFVNLLMEPNINADLTHSLVPPSDLTLAQMRDIGWFRFTTCAVEGFTGSQLSNCQNVCKVGLSAGQYAALAVIYRAIYRTDPPCAAPGR